MSVTAKRILIVHSDPETRRAIAAAIRELGDDGFAVFEAESPTDAIDKARRFDPRVVLLDLGEARALALDVATRLRGEDRLIIGLYNPLVTGLGENELLRSAARAGVGDFAPLPVSAPDLGAAFSAAHVLGGGPPDEEGAMVAFFSHKGGVGTTTLAVNAALALAGSTDNARETVLIDANLQFGDAAGLLGLQPEQDLTHFVNDLDRLGALESYLAREPQTGLRILAGPVDPLEAERITPDEVCRTLIHLRRRFPCLLVDLPPVIDLLTMSILDLSEILCVVTEPVTPTVLNTARCLRFLEEQGISGERVRIILNRKGFPHGALSEREVADALGRAIDVAIPFDARVMDAGDTGQPLVLTRAKSDFMRSLVPFVEQLLPAAKPPVATGEEL